VGHLVRAAEVRGESKRAPRATELSWTIVDYVVELNECVVVVNDSAVIVEITIVLSRINKINCN
jgi:hypothetical protein